MPYIITEKTLALLPSENGAMIYEMDEIKILNIKPNDIIKDNCIMNGSSLEGRQKGSAYLIGTTYKAPIVIRDNIIFIPTNSARNKTCAWINLLGVKKYTASNETTKITLINNQIIDINISYNIFDKQILRATRLAFATNVQKNQK